MAHGLKSGIHCKQTQFIEEEIDVYKRSISGEKIYETWKDKSTKRIEVAILQFHFLHKENRYLNIRVESCRLKYTYKPTWAIVI